MPQSLKNGERFPLPVNGRGFFSSSCYHLQRKNASAKEKGLHESCTHHMHEKNAGKKLKSVAKQQL